MDETPVDKFVITLNNKLETIEKKSAWSWVCDLLKAGAHLMASCWKLVNYLRITSKKTRNLDESTSEPKIHSCAGALNLSCDTGQRIPCFDSWQLTTTPMCNIRLQTLTVARKCESLHIGIPVAQTDEWTDRQTYGHVTTKISRMDR